MGGATAEPPADQFREQVAALRALGGNDWLCLLNRMHRFQPVTEAPASLCEEASSRPVDQGESPAVSWSEMALPDWLLRVGLQQASFQDQLQAQAKGHAPDWVVWCVCIEAQATSVVCAVANSAGFSLLELEHVLGGSGAVVPQFGRCTTIAPCEMVQLLKGPHRCYLELRTGFPHNNTLLLLPASAEDTDDLARRFTTAFGLECQDKFSPQHVECVAVGALSAVRFCGRILLNDVDAGVVHYALVARKEIVVVVENVFNALRTFEVKRTWNVALPVVDVQLPEHWPSAVDAVDEFKKCGFGVAISFEGGEQFVARFQARDSRNQFLEAFLAARNS